MNLGGVRIGRLGAGERERLLAGARGSEPTYDHVGSTLDPDRWDAAEVRSRHLDVGRGLADFEAAREALQTWVPQLGIGASVEPPHEPVVEGATVLVVLRKGPAHVVVPDRVVQVIDEPRRFAFAYGTLPGHPERGEESFTVELLADETVRVTIRVQAVPGTFAARLAGPVVITLQNSALAGYLRATADHVRASNPIPPPNGAPS